MKVFIALSIVVFIALCVWIRILVTSPATHITTLANQHQGQQDSADISSIDTSSSNSFETTETPPNIQKLDVVSSIKTTIQPKPISKNKTVSNANLTPDSIEKSSEPVAQTDDVAEDTNLDQEPAEQWKYKITDLSGKNTGWTQQTKHIPIKKRWFVLSPRGALLVLYHNGLRIREFYQGNEQHLELWVHFIKTDHYAMTREMTIYDKIDLSEIPSGYIYATNCTKEYLEYLSINAVVKQKEGEIKYNVGPNTSEESYQPIQQAWYFDVETMKYQALEDLNDITCRLNNVLKTQRARLGGRKLELNTP